MSISCSMIQEFFLRYWEHQLVWADWNWVARSFLCVFVAAQIFTTFARRYFFFLFDAPSLTSLVGQVMFLDRVDSRLVFLLFSFHMVVSSNTPVGFRTFGIVRFRLIVVSWPLILSLFVSVFSLRVVIDRCCLYLYFVLQFVLLLFSLLFGC